jgi:hypothetical protein
LFTIDNDTRSELRLLMTFLNASNLGDDRVSATHHGYHHRVVKQGLGDYPKQARENLRMMLGDDSRRMYFEQLEKHRGIGSQWLMRTKTQGSGWEDTLFEAKQGRDGKWHFEELVDNVLALPFWSSTRAKKLVTAPRKQWKRKKYAKRTKKA